MKIDREFVLSYLKGKQIEQGGYYGTDLSDLAKLMKATYRATRMRITKWTKEDPDFSNLVYLGKSPPSITLDEFIEIKDRIQSNPLEVKKHILSDIRDKRELRGEEVLSTATFYRRAKQVELSLFTNNECYRWFSERKIKIPSFYSVEDERESLSNAFHFHNLKPYGGADIEAIYERFKKAKEWFSRYEVDPMRFYPALLTRGTKLRSLLTSIPPAQQEEIQARISEVQINEGEEFLTPDILDKLIEGTFNLNIWLLLEAVSFNDMDYDENEDILPSWVNFSDVLKDTDA